MSASNREVKGFKSFIYEIIHRQQGPAGGTTQGPERVVKRVKVANFIPVANKKVTTKADIDKVVNEIKEKLIQALDDADGLNLE